MKLLFAVCAAFLTMAAPLAADVVTTERNMMTDITPTVLGRVTATSSHTVTVSTLEGESMVFEVDSRTVMPLDLDNGERVRVEFRLMDSGQHHAGRITPLAPGSHDWELMDQAAMYEMDPGGGQRASQVHAVYAAEPAATSEGREGGVEEVVDIPEGTAEEQREANEDMNREGMNTDTEARDRDQLPVTASPLPLALAGGTLLIGTAAGMWLERRRRKV